MKQEADSKDKLMHIKKSDLWICDLRQEDERDFSFGQFQRSNETACSIHI